MSASSFDAEFCAAVAARAAKLHKVREALVIDDEVARLVRLRRIRSNFQPSPRDFVRSQIPFAVGRGMAELIATEAARERRKALIHFSEDADRASTCIERFKNGPYFKIPNLLEMMPPGESSQSLEAGARELHASIIAGQRAARRLAQYSKRRAEGIRVTDPGECFKRGFVLEMMKAYWLLTGKDPGTSRGLEGNPFVRFADAALRSVLPDDAETPPPSGLLRSLLKEFLAVRDQGAFDGALISLIEHRDMSPPENQ